MEELKLTVAENITELRKKNGMTQMELANKLNYSDKAISKWERGDSLPDVAVLKELADLFGVTLDYIVNKEHKKTDFKQHKKNNRAFITAISMLGVWLIATLCFVMLDISPNGVTMHWLSFVYAVPVSLVVWLVFNSIWFKRHRNYLIVSLLLWSAFASAYLTLLAYGFNFWLIFVIGVPAQLIIILWSKIKYKN